MQHLPEIIGIATALTAGAASPGPSFVMVARVSASMGRLNGLLAALGMGFGGLIFAIASLLGLHGVLLAIPSLYLLLKVGCGLYLAYLGFRIWKGACTPLVAEIQRHDRSFHYLQNFWYWALPLNSVIRKRLLSMPVFLPHFFHQIARWPLRSSLHCSSFLIEASWYALVAIVLSAPKPRNLYLRGKTWFDRVAVGVMIALGVKSVTSYERG
ncbi:LysE family translocator [Dickeya oryzae]